MQYQPQHPVTASFTDIRKQLTDAISESVTRCMDRACHDALARVGLTLKDAVSRLTRRYSMGSEELLLDGEMILQLQVDWTEDAVSVRRTFHGAALERRQC